jgi:hypothetical protein
VPRRVEHTFWGVEIIMRSQFMTCNSVNLRNSWFQSILFFAHDKIAFTVDSLVVVAKCSHATHIKISSSLVSAHHKTTLLLLLLLLLETKMGGYKVHFLRAALYGRYEMI